MVSTFISISDSVSFESLSTLRLVDFGDGSSMELFFGLQKCSFVGEIKLSDAKRGPFVSFWVRCSEGRKKLNFWVVPKG